MAKPLTLDVHAHILPEETIKELAKLSPRVAPIMIKKPDGSYDTEINGRLVQRPMPPEIWDVGMRLRDMDANGVDMQLLSNNIPTFFYGEEPSLALEAAKLQNEHISALVKKYPTRFLGIGTIPMQAPREAAEELRRIMTTLGLRGIQIGSNIENRNLDDPALDPVWAVANELKAFILIHPHGDIVVNDRLSQYYMRNFIGLTLETTQATACILFGGVVERFPDIRFCLCHAGGYAPYQFGRFLHAWNVRPEGKTRLKGSLQESFNRLYFDTITHAPDALRFLVDKVTPQRVLLGSDYPFDMGNLDCVARVEAAALPTDVTATILGAHARALLDEAGTGRSA